MWYSYASLARVLYIIAAGGRQRAMGGDATPPRPTTTPPPRRAKLAAAPVPDSAYRQLLHIAVSGKQDAAADQGAEEALDGEQDTQDCDAT